MLSVSVVVITLDEEHNIADCVRSARLVSNDIVVVDCGSSDSTRQLAAAAGARVFEIEWQGYGHARNLGAMKAADDWVFAMDADERISTALVNSIRKLRPQSDRVIYRVRRRNHLCGKRIRFGTPGFELVTRIYNRHQAQWDHSPVHEKLSTASSEKQKISGYIDHFGLKNMADYRGKMEKYARLSAEKYFYQGKNGDQLRRILSPVFNALKSYLFLLGFLDGRTGFIVAKMIARYSWLKYSHLQQKLRTTPFKAADATQADIG